ncbi:glycosyltransferase family 4 protein [Dermacoccaceae bacterium W4C1]
MRILMVVGLVAGGAGAHVRTLVQDLAEAGDEVVLAAPAQVHEAFALPAGTARRVEVPIAERPHPLADAQTARALRRLASQVDVVHAHGIRAGALAAGVPGARHRLVVTLHNAAPAGRSSAAVFTMLARVVAARAALVLVVAPDLGDLMRGYGAAAVDTAVVAAPAAEPGSAQRGRACLGAGSRGQLLALTVARLAPQKGLEVLCDAAALCQAAGVPVRFVVAGEGPLRQNLTERIAARALPIRLLGRRSDVPDLLAAADLVVSAAYWEGQPVWLQEAAAAGVAIVSTDAGGTRELLGDDAALWVRPGDAEELAHAIQQVCGEESRRDHLDAQALSAAQRLPDRRQAREAAQRGYQRVIRASRS